MSEQITGYSVAGVIEADPDSQFVWVKFVDAQTVTDVAVAVAREQEQESFVDRLGKVYEQGLRDALAAVIDRVDEVYGDTDGRPSYAGVMDAIKGEGDD